MATSQEVIRQQAELAAAKVDPRKTEKSIVAIVGILIQVWPIIAGCINREEEADPAMVKARIEREHERRPQQQLRRTARRIRGEADEPMTKAESFEYARVSIAQALEADNEVVAAAMSV